MHNDAKYLQGHNCCGVDTRLSWAAEIRLLHKIRQQRALFTIYALTNFTRCRLPNVPDRLCIVHQVPFLVPILLSFGQLQSKATSRYTFYKSWAPAQPFSTAWSDLGADTSAVILPQAIYVFCSDVSLTCLQ